MSNLTQKGAAMLRAIRLDFEQLGELEKDAPDDVELIVRAMVAHLRSWKPMALQAPAEVHHAP